MLSTFPSHVASCEQEQPRAGKSREIKNNAVRRILTQAVNYFAGLDPRGEQVVWQASGWAARIIQHEMDHLQGCLFIDKMDSKTFTNIHWMEVND